MKVLKNILVAVLVALIAIIVAIFVMENVYISKSENYGPITLTETKSLEQVFHEETGIKGVEIEIGNGVLTIE